MPARCDPRPAGAFVWNMDVVNGTAVTAIIGGLIIVVFLLGPRIVAGPLVEEQCCPDVTMAQFLRGLLDKWRRYGFAELKAFASAGALVLTGLTLAAIYSLLTQRIVI